MDRSVKIIAWNANGLRGRKNELHYFLADLDVDVALISETHLTQEQNFRIPAYVTYRVDRPARAHGRNPGGGIAILVHRRLVHHESATASGAMETNGVVIHAGGREVLLVAAYQPPNSPLDRDTLNSLLDTQKPVLIAGDLNAKHATWNSIRPNQLGKALRNYVNHRGDVTVIAPTEPTHYPANHRQLPDVLDIALHRNLPFDVTADSVNDLSSDHSPLLLTMDVAPTTRFPRPGH